MHRTIIADASCLIILTNVGRLDLLHEVYGAITTTPQVAAEYKLVLPAWINVMAPVSGSMVEKLNERIDLGEASAIALALEIPDHTLILDDKAAREVADAAGLHTTGTLGVVTKAKSDGHITQVAPILAELKVAGFRMSDALMRAVLAVNGEGR